MRLIFVLILNLFCSNGHCQTLRSIEKLYSLVFDGSAITSTDYCHYVAGGFNNSLIIKLDSDLHPIWSVQLKRPNNNLQIESLNQDGDLLHFAGQVRDTLYTNPSSNPKVLFIGSIDTATGQIVNSKIFGDSLFSFCNQTIPTSDDGFIMVGNCHWDINIPNSRSDGFVLKYDSQSNIIWSKCLSANYTTTIQCIAQIDNFYYLGGFSADSLDSRNALLIKIDSAGSVLWSHQFDTGSNESIRTIVFRNDTLFLAGDVSFFPSIPHVYIGAMDTSANYYWTKQLQSQTPLNSSKLIAYDSDKLYLIDGGGLRMLFQSNSNITNYQISNNSFSGASVVFPYFYSIGGGQFRLIKSDSSFASCLSTNYSLQSNIISFSKSSVNILQSSFNIVDKGYVTDSTYTIIDSTFCQMFTTDNIIDQPLFRIYPNPSYHHIELTSANGNPIDLSKIQIIDLMGRRQKIAIILKELDHVDIDISELNSGLYIVIHSDYGLISKIHKI